jgi:hypothetical protein
MHAEEIAQLVLETLRMTNQWRPADQQLEVSREAPIFGPPSPLDSLGLVALLIDLEEQLQARGYGLTFSDAAAMSEQRSPFRNVPSLVDYIAKHLADVDRCRHAAS